MEITWKIIKSEGLLRVTPPKNKKNKKLWEKAGAVGGVGVRGGGGVDGQLLDNCEDTKNTKRNTLKYNTLQRLQDLFFTYNTDVLHKKGEKGIIFIDY